MSKLAVCTVVAALSAPVAFAQDTGNPFERGRYVSVTDRVQPEFDPEAIQLGGLQAHSYLGLGAEYNDNIYAQENGAVEDTILRVNPHIDLFSTWSTHAVSAGLDINHREYTDLSSESTTDYFGYLGGRVDVNRSLWFGARATGGQFSEMRYAPSAVNNAEEPTQFDRFGGELTSNWRNDRFQLNATLGTEQDDFDDVPLIGTTATLPQDFRDVTRNYLKARGSYAVSPDLAFFVQGEAIDLDYDLAFDPLGQNRDSERRYAQVGASFELQAPFRGDVAIGYVEEEKADPTLQGTDGLSLDGNIEWFPTELTTVTVRGLRDLFDPGFVGSSTAVRTNYGVRVDHELRRNLLVFGEANGGTVEFQGLLNDGITPYDREDDLLDASLGVAYKMNKRVRVEAAYTYRDQESDGAQADRNFDQNGLSVSLKVYP